MGVGIDGEEGLGHFGRFRVIIIALARHLPLAGAADAMGIDGQESSGKMTGGAAEVTEGPLHALGIVHRVFGEQLMDGAITGQKGQAVEQFKAALAQGALAADAGQTQRRLMHQLHRQARLDAVGAPAGPGVQEIPGAQTKVFGDQQPQADEITADLVGQQWTNTPFEAARIAGLGFDAGGGALGLQARGFGVRAIAVEFFFVGRIVR